MFRVHTPIIRSIGCWIAAALKTTTHPKTQLCKNLFINSTEKYFNHHTPIVTIEPTTTLNTHNPHRDSITNTHNPQHKSPLPTTRWAQTSSPHTKRPVQYSIDRTDKHLYNTAYNHYTHTFILCHSLQCRKPYAATQHPVLLMMGVFTWNMSC